MAGASWWVVIPQTDQGASTAYKESVDLRVQYPAGSAGDKAMRSRLPYNDPNFGQWVVYWKGPYASEAQAKTAQNPQPSPENLLQAAQKSADNTLTGGSGTFGLHVTGIAAWFLRALKVTFGGILILIGVSHLTGLSNQLTQTAGKLAPIAAVAA